MNETELLIEFCKTWNNLNTIFIENLLHEDVEYSSQWLLDSIYGKKNLLSFLDNKFKLIINSKESTKIEADIGFFEAGNHYYIEKPCIILRQYNSTKSILVTILIECFDEKITKIDMCGIPNPEKAKKFGLFPK